MATDDIRSVWREDAKTLAAIGAVLCEQPCEVDVRVPKPLADAAVAAWHRDDGTGGVEGETLEDRVTRQRAGSLALLGLTIENGGVDLGDEIAVRVFAQIIGDALNAADDVRLSR